MIELSLQDYEGFGYFVVTINSPGTVEIRSLNSCLKQSDGGYGTSKDDDTFLTEVKACLFFLVGGGKKAWRAIARAL